MVAQPLCPLGSACGGSKLDSQASKALPRASPSSPDPPICYTSPRPDIRPPLFLNCLTFFLKPGQEEAVDLLGKNYDNVTRARNISLGGQEIFYLEGKKYDYIGPALWQTLNPEEALTLHSTRRSFNY